MGMAGLVPAILLWRLRCLPVQAGRDHQDRQQGHADRWRLPGDLSALLQSEMLQQGYPFTVMAGLVPAIPPLRSAVLFKSRSPAQGR
jgi:hypothetical protein